MLKSFGVRNFRCLADFELHGLARINLFVGDNDAGKTALLEAIYVHLLQANLLNILVLKAFRKSPPVVDETWWDEYFTGFDSSKEIQLSSVDSNGVERSSAIKVARSARISVAVPPASGGVAREGVPAPPASQPTSFRPLTVEFKGGANQQPVTNEVTYQGTVFTQKAANEPDMRGNFFSAAGMPEPLGIATRLGKLIEKKQQEPVVALAKALDERVRDVTTASPRGVGQVFVDLGEPRLYPLTLMGSGVARSVDMAATILDFQPAVMLVDEIDEGIYYQRLRELWKGLYEMAKRFDVQIIASTHSGECVTSAIQSVQPDLKDNDPLHVYRIVQNKRVPVPYERESLESVVEFMGETR